MSTVLLEKRLLISSLLSIELQEKIDKLNEIETCAAALFITNTVLKTVEDFKKSCYKKFDANPGDGGCQMRALELHQLVKNCSLLEECDSLKKEVSKKSFVTKKQSQERTENCLMQTFTEQFCAEQALI